MDSDPCAGSSLTCCYSMFLPDGINQSSKVMMLIIQLAKEMKDRVYLCNLCL